MKKVSRIPLSSRVYMDETYIMKEPLAIMGRSPKGKVIHKPGARHSPRCVVLSAIRQNEIMHPAIVKNYGTMTNEDFEEYVKDTLAPLLQPEDVVFWDRAGKRGRQANPTELHWSPAAKQAIERAGAKLQLLPAYGKLFNPIELLFSATKSHFSKMRRALQPDWKTRFPPFPTIKRLYLEAEEKIESKHILQYFKVRANGKHFVKYAKERGLMKNKK